MMGMRVIVLVTVFVRELDQMVRLSRGTHRVDVHDRSCEKREMRYELAMNVGTDRVALLDVQRGLDSDVHLGRQLMPELARVEVKHTG